MRHSFSILTTISVFVLTSTTSYAATRHCTATVKANVYSAKTQSTLNAPPIKKLDVFSFKAGGVATLPNKARNRAKKNAYQCITQHFFTYYLASENGGITGMPRDCTTANRIPEYDMTKSLYKKIKSTVCGALPQKNISYKLGYMYQVKKVVRDQCNFITMIIPIQHGAKLHVIKPNSL